MTDDDKALKWLDDVIGQPVCFAGERTHARRVREMLGRAMPEEPSEEALQAIRDAHQPHGWINASVAYRALCDHLTEPKTKEVEVDGWAVVSPDGYVGVIQRTKEDAETWLWRCKQGSTVVHLTGKATVPA